MKKAVFWIGLIALLFALVSTVSAGGDQEVTGEKGAKEVVTLKFTYWGSPNEKTAVVDAMKGFENTYDWIRVEAQHIAGDYDTKMATMIAGGTEPDIAYLNIGQAFPWAAENKLYNIYDLIATDPEMSKSDFLDSIWYNWAPGKSFGTNSAVESMALFYNVDMFEEAGVPLPPTKAEDAWTWDEFVHITQQLTIDQNGNNALSPNFDSENIKQFGFQFSTWYAHYMTMVYSNGGDYISEDGTRFALTRPEAIDAIQKLADLINVYHVSPSPVQAKNIPGGAAGLQTKKVAMKQDGQWCLLDLGASGLNFGVGVLPKLKKSVTLVLGAPTVIFSSTDHPEEAWLLYKYLANPQSVLNLMAGGLWMPLLKNWYTEPELVGKWAEENPAHPEGYRDAIMRQTMENGVPGVEYYVMNWGELNNLVNPALAPVWLGKKTARQALEEIEEKANTLVIGRYGL
jgi:multiple sugar transport system substrate-binding protein